MRSTDRDYAESAAHFCTCTVFHDTPCSSQMTQEDLLCDPCRLYAQRCAALGKTLTTTGVHAGGGPAGSPRPHTTDDPRPQEHGEWRESILFSLARADLISDDL